MIPVPFVADLPPAAIEDPLYAVVNTEGETAEDLLAEIQASLSLGCLSLD